MRELTREKAEQFSIQVHVLPKQWDVSLNPPCQQKLSYEMTVHAFKKVNRKKREQKKLIKICFPSPGDDGSSSASDRPDQRLLLLDHVGHHRSKPQPKGRPQRQTKSRRFRRKHFLICFIELSFSIKTFSNLFDRIVVFDYNIF